jgi:hypothetical protein
MTARMRGRLALLLLSLPLYALAAGARQQPGVAERKVVVHPAVAELPARPKRYALVVGVDDYADAQIGALGGAADDARLLAGALVERAGFPAEQVILLASGEPPERQPTRGQILRRLSNLAATVPRDGLLLFSFAGHGIERGGRAFLLPSDAQLNGDVELLEQTAVEADWVRKRIEASGVRQVLMLLDACRDDPGGGRSAAANALTETYRRAFNFELRNRGVEAFATVYATAVGGRAYESAEKGHGYFTWALVEGLRGGAADARGEVTLAGLLKYVQESVPRRVALDLGPGRDQRPFADISGYRADDLVLAVTGGAKPPEVLPPGPATGGGPATVKGTKSKEKSGRVLFFSDYDGTGFEGPEYTGADGAFWLALSRALTGKGLSTTVGAERDRMLFSEALRSLERGEKSAGKAMPFAVVITVKLSVKSLDPYNGLHVAEVTGTLKALDSDSGAVIAQEVIYRARGFGNTAPQASDNALASAGEKVSESFIERVVAAAR